MPEYRIKEVVSASYLEHRFPEGDAKPEDEKLQDGQGAADLVDGVEDEDSDATFVEEESDESDDEDLDDEINLDDLSYAELQEMAKGYGIKANQSREDLTEQILAADEEE